MARPLLLRANTSNLSDAMTTSQPGSPASSRPPITPQNAHFWDSYFPATQAPEGLVAGMQTPPIGSSSSATATEHALLAAVAAFPGRRALLRRNSSLSSMASSIDGERDDEDEDDPEWTVEEEDLVRRTYEAFLMKHATIEAPFARTGPPPSNFTNMVARAILRGGARVPPARRSAAARKATFFSASSPSESMDVSDSELRSDRWRHTLRNTRLKILALAKERQEPSAIEATPRQSDDPDATPKRRKPLTRNDSMDFLPDVQVAASITRLGNKLRHPSVDGGVPTPSLPTIAQTGLRALAHPSPQLGALGVPLSRSLSTRPSQRMQRNNSLQSIAGSPSQPKRTRAQAVPEPDKLAPPQLSSLRPPSSQRMARTGSDSSVLPAPSLSRNLSFSGSSGGAGSASSSSSRSTFTLGASPLKKPTRKMLDNSLLTPPPSSSKKRPQPFSFLSSSSASSSAGSAPTLDFRNRLNLTVDTTRTTGDCALGSAFSSPAVGVFPSPTSRSPKKKRAKTEASPVKAPSFGNGSGAQASSSLGDSAVGLGFGLALGPTFSTGAAHMTDGPTASRAEFESPEESEQPMSPFARASASPTSRSFTLLDPSLSPTSLASRRNSPPKLVLTPSLSPTSSFPSTFSSLPDTPSPLDATFDFRALKLESLAGSPVDVVPSGSAEEEDDDSDDSFGCDGGSNAFLAQEYIKAGNDAQLLRDRFGGWAWERA
ncbi:hypothetical protein JCM10908_001852 [Rhodotorula pacifica]|uniref:uncharacterized protein n=1 Tax=Rhodotorula pacifica TaxID=1495444 RepID=UPI003170CE23